MRMIFTLVIISLSLLYGQEDLLQVKVISECGTQFRLCKSSLALPDGSLLQETHFTIEVELVGKNAGRVHWAGVELALPQLGEPVVGTARVEALSHKRFLLEIPLNERQSAMVESSLQKGAIVGVKLRLICGYYLYHGLGPVTVSGDWDQFFSVFHPIERISFAQLQERTRAALTRGILRSDCTEPLLAKILAGYLCRNYFLYEERKGRLRLRFLSALSPDRALIEDPAYLEKEIVRSLAWKGSPAPEQRIVEIHKELADTSATGKIDFYFPPRFFARWKIRRIVVFPEKREKGKRSPGYPISLTTAFPQRSWSFSIRSRDIRLYYRLCIYRNHGPVQNSVLREIFSDKKHFSLPRHFENILETTASTLFSD